MCHGARAHDRPAHGAVRLDGIEPPPARGHRRRARAATSPRSSSRPGAAASRPRSRPSCRRRSSRATGPAAGSGPSVGGRLRVEPIADPAAHVGAGRAQHGAERRQGEQRAPARASAAGGGAPDGQRAPAWAARSTRSVRSAASRSPGTGRSRSARRSSRSVMPPPPAPRRGDRALGAGASSRCRAGSRAHARSRRASSRGGSAAPPRRAARAPARASAPSSSSEISRRVGRRLGARRASSAPTSRRSAPGASEVDRAVDHDPVDPGRERAPAVEAVERPHGGEERLLGDVLGGCRVVDDVVGRAEGGRPVQLEERLERLARAVLGRAHEPPLRGPAGLVARPRSRRPAGAGSSVRSRSARTLAVEPLTPVTARHYVLTADRGPNRWRDRLEPDLGVANQRWIEAE